MGEGRPKRGGAERVRRLTRKARSAQRIVAALPEFGARKTACREVFVVEDLPPLVISRPCGTRN
jgi:hypothetical protein